MRRNTCLDNVVNHRLAAQVRAELNAEGRDLVIWVDRLGRIGLDEAAAKAREHQRRQQEHHQGANLPARGHPDDDMDIETANSVLSKLQLCIHMFLRRPMYATVERPNGCVVAPAPDSAGPRAWEAAAAAALQLLRGLRAEGGALRLGLSVRLQVRPFGGLWG